MESNTDWNDSHCVWMSVMRSPALHCILTIACYESILCVWEWIMNEDSFSLCRSGLFAEYWYSHNSA